MRRGPCPWGWGYRGDTGRWSAEELLTQCDNPAEQAEFLQGLAGWAGRIVVVVRADRIDELAAYAGFASLLERGLFVLQPLDERGLRAAIEGRPGQPGSASNRAWSTSWSRNASTSPEDSRCCPTCSPRRGSGSRATP